MYIKYIYEDDELKEEATVRDFRIVQTEGIRRVARMQDDYNLDMIMGIGRVRI